MDGQAARRPQPSAHFVSSSAPRASRRRSKFDVGVAADKVITGDFNNDGLLDLVTSSSSAENVSLVVGNGDGTFKPGVDYVSSSYPSAIASGDFDRDGRLDLAVAHSGGVTILFNQGCMLP